MGRPVVPLEKTRYARVFFVADLGVILWSFCFLPPLTISSKLLRPLTWPSRIMIELSGSPTSFAAASACGSRWGSTNIYVAPDVRSEWDSSNGVEKEDSSAKGTVNVNRAFTIAT